MSAKSADSICDIGFIVHPKPKAIIAAREKSGLTQAAAGTLIGYSRRAWQSWELGKRAMRPALLETFKKLSS